MSEEEYEWGPWVEHDGTGCPCKGEFVHVIFADGTSMCGIAGKSADVAMIYGFDLFVFWKWAVVQTSNKFATAARIVRYRIRRRNLRTLFPDFYALETAAPKQPERV